MNRRTFSNRIRSTDRPKDWCLIRPRAVHGAPVDQLPAATEVYIYDEIGYWGTTASDFVAQLTDIGTSQIDLHLNSPGGEVFEGLAIYECLRVHPANVTTYVDSLAASIASVIAMSGNEIVMGRNAQMMIHDASGGCWGNPADMRETADLLDKLSDNIASVYADKCGKKTTAQWRELMLAETWFFASEAVDVGLADTLAPNHRADTEDPVMPSMDSWDLSVFRYRNRVEAPPPVLDLTTPDLPDKVFQTPPADLVGDMNETIRLLKEAFR